MATQEEVRTGLFSAILGKMTGEKLSAQQILWLSEAYAWVVSPIQAHGGGTNPPAK